MLVLSRKRGQKIVIVPGGVEINVMVVKILGDRVWLGIEAPVEVPVHRREVLDAIQRGDGS
jgi:carbon storage regulator